MKELIEACIATPDDDAPRLVWADAVGGERGEFVVIQCSLARGNLSRADVDRLRARQRQLLERHGAEWSQLQGEATRVMFRRGFVEAAELDCGRFVDSLFDRAPLLRSLTATGLRSVSYSDPESSKHDVMRRLDALMRSPLIRRLVGLSLHEPFHVDEPSGNMRSFFGAEEEYSYYGDAAIRLADELGVHHLRAFGLKHSRGLVALRQTAILQNVERLYLEEDCELDDLIQLLHASVTPKLTALELGMRVDLDRLVPYLPPQLRELRVPKSTDEPSTRSQPVVKTWFARESLLHTHRDRDACITL